MNKDIKKYVRSCESCARAKAVRHKPFGLLKPLPIGQRPWSSLSVDHIGELPESNGFNAKVQCTTTDIDMGCAAEYSRYQYINNKITLQYKAISKPIHQ